MSYVVRSKTKEFVKTLDMSISSESVESLSTMVEDIVKRAAERAEANGRKVIKTRDL